MCLWVCFIWAASQVALVVKNPPANAGRCKRRGFNPWVRKIPWRRAWQLAAVFLPGESHGQRSLVGCSPRGRKESDTTEVTLRAQCSEGAELSALDRAPTLS